MSAHIACHALVIGASGLIGWSVVDQLLQPYPSPSPFSKVTALVNRPLKLEDSFWPARSPDRPEWALESGINLLCSDAEFEKLLKQKVPDIENVSHVYYFVFKEDADHEMEVKINVGMMRRVVHAMKNLSLAFKFFVYPGGTRGYGIYQPDGIFTAPLTEDLADKLPESYRKTVSYPHYRAMLVLESANQAWTWCELVPDAIIGFTPNGSGFSLAGHWAVYLCAYKLVHGVKGIDIWNAAQLDSYGYWLTFDRHLSLKRLRDAEFKEERRPQDGWSEAFDMFKRAGMIV